MHRVTVLHDSLGVLVEGIDLNRQIPTQLIQQLLWDHLVVAFPQQRLTPDSHAHLARALGTPVVHPFFETRVEHPEIVVIDNDRSTTANWHSDMSYEAEPPSISIASMVLAPSTGGATLWTSQYAAYSLLPESTKQKVDGLQAVHTTADGDRFAIHPVVLQHPITGRSYLTVSRHFTRSIVGMQEGPSDELLETLFSACEAPNHQLSYLWASGDVVIWDNRGTLHSGRDDYSERRRLERISVL